MDSIPAQTDTPAPESVLRLLSAYEISLVQETSMFDPPIEVVNPKAGDTCPQCQIVKIDYDGMLNLSCPDCGYTLAGCST